MLEAPMVRFGDVMKSFGVSVSGWGAFAVLFVASLLAAILPALALWLLTCHLSEILDRARGSRRPGGAGADSDDSELFWVLLCLLAVAIFCAVTGYCNSIARKSDYAYATYVFSVAAIIAFTGALVQVWTYLLPST
jgi:thiol:disulfide interchange protein